jgi:PmbA protein
MQNTSMNELARAEQILEMAQRLGAEAVEVYSSTSRSRPVVFEANRLKQLESSESAGMAVRVWMEGRPGLAVAYGEVNPEPLVENAIAIANLNPSEPIELPDSTPITPSDRGTWIDSEALIDLGDRTIAQVLDTYPDVLCSFSAQCDRDTVLLLTSNGFHGQYATTSLSTSIGVEWVRGEDFLGIYDDLDSDTLPHPDHLLAATLEHLTWAQHHTAPPTGQVPVLFTPKAASLLWDVVADAMNAKACHDGSSPWSKRHGQSILAPNLTLRQDPQQGSGYCPMDDEGTPTQALTLMEGGVFTQMYCDRTLGRRFGLPSTGNGFRSDLGRYPSPDLVNLLIDPGDLTAAQLRHTITDGLIVDQVLGGGADLSGDFSVNVDLGYRVRNGKIIGRVKDTMVTGNVYAALGQDVRLGCDRTWQGNVATPSVVVQGLSVVGDD